MNYTWTESQLDRYVRTLDLCARRLNPAIRARGACHSFGRGEWDDCAEFGLMGLSVPEESGGHGLDMLSTTHVMEAFGRGCEDMGLVFSVAAHLFAATMPVAEFGSAAQRSEQLPR